MKDLQTEGYAAKYLLNLKKQNALNQDLNFLKTCGGPFTSKQEISAYMQEDEDEAAKIKRLYIEVRYARTTSLTLPANAKLFRLRSDANKKMNAEEYAKNLAQYLDDHKSIGGIDMQELNGVLEKLKTTRSKNTRIEEGIADKPEHIVSHFLFKFIFISTKDYELIFVKTGHLLL